MLIKCSGGCMVNKLTIYLKFEDMVCLAINYKNKIKNKKNKREDMKNSIIYLTF